VEAYDAAATAGHGVLTVAGSMVDLPVVERARGILAEADRR
jgi:citrate lyase beta subunit